MFSLLPKKYNLPVAYIPVNYTVSGKFVDSHFKAIDAKLLTTSITSTVLTGYTSGAGTVAATDTILAAIQKLNGNTAAITPSAPVTVTAATSTIAAASSTQIFNGSATHTVTLPAAASNSGKTINLKNIVAFAVNSATSNVVPINSATAGTAIIAATAGKFARLQSDGTNWIIIESN